jgi:hypothetical protein
MKLWERFKLWIFNPPKQVVLNGSSVLVTKDEKTDALRVELHQEFGDVVLQETILGWNIYVAEIDKDNPVGYLDLFNTREEERVDGPIFEILIEDPQSPVGEPVAIAKYYSGKIKVVVNKDADEDRGYFGEPEFNWERWQDGGELEVDFT